MDYSLLDLTAQIGLRRRRLSELEATHYGNCLVLEELPPGSEQAVVLGRENAELERRIAHHRDRLPGAADDHPQDAT